MLVAKEERIDLSDGLPAKEKAIGGSSAANFDQVSSFGPQQQVS